MAPDAISPESTPPARLARIHERLAALRREHASGLEALAEIQRKEQELRATLLRISGAIQVLEELLGEPDPAPPETP
jgi:hypothetical protein